ncbi:hypothetical protein B0J14DRAFT_578335 [Halenospora varia]|nr:hypothetical protein B0J14DRAFT_578335 [Halenospora varia]
MEEPLARPPMAYMSPRQFSDVPTEPHTGYPQATAHFPPGWDNIHMEAPNQATSAGAGSRFHTAVSRELVKYSKPVTNKLQKAEKSQKSEPYRSPDPMVFSPPLGQSSREDNKRQTSLKRRRTETSVKSGQYFPDSRRPAKRKNIRPDPKGSLSPSKSSTTGTQGLQSEASGYLDAAPQRRKDLHVTIEEVPDSYFNTSPRTFSRASSSDTDATITTIKVKTPDTKTHRLSGCTLVENRPHESIEIMEHDFADCATIPIVNRSLPQHASGDCEKVTQGANEYKNDFQHPLVDCPTDFEGDDIRINDKSTLSEHTLENCPLDSLQTSLEKAAQEGRAFDVKRNNHQHALSECETCTTHLSNKNAPLPLVQHKLDECQMEASEAVSNEDDFQHSLQLCPPQPIQEEIPARRRGRYQHTLTDRVEEDPPIVEKKDQHYLESCSPKVSAQKKELSYVHDFTECQVDQTILDYYESEENRAKQHGMTQCSLSASSTFQTPRNVRRRSSSTDLGTYSRREPRQHRMSSCPSLGTEDIRRLQLDEDILQGKSDVQTTSEVPKVPFNAKRRGLGGSAMDKAKNKVIKTKQSYKRLAIQASEASGASLYLAARESDNQPSNHGNDQPRNREMQQVDRPAWVGKLVTSIGKVSLPHGLSAQQSLESLFTTPENQTANALATRKMGKMRKTKAFFEKPRHAKSAEMLSTAYRGDDTVQLMKVQSNEESKGTQPGGIQRLINKMTSFTSMKPMREVQLRPHEPRSWRGHSN